MLGFGNAILEIVFGTEGSGTGALPHMALAVEHPEDVDDLLERCLAFGCALERPAADVEGVEDGSGGPGETFRLRNGFCTGPAGESLEFFYEY